MKVRLLHPSRTFEASPMPANASDLVADLELGVLLDGCRDSDPGRGGDGKAGDAFLPNAWRRVLLVGLDDLDAIHYRQAVLADCLERPGVVRELYDIAVAAITAEGKIWGAFLDQYAESALARATSVLELFAGYLRRLREIADRHGPGFRSDGFRALMADLTAELGDGYLREVEGHLQQLTFRDGMVLTARLGPGNVGTGFVLRRPTAGGRPGLRRRVALLDRTGYTYRIPDESEGAARAFAALKSQGISGTAAALAQSTDQVLAFFRSLRFELGFYVGCLNLHERLAAKGVAMCVPAPQPAGSGRLAAKGLCDAALALTLDDAVVANDLAADGRALIVVTGANRGGKSTLVRSLGQAQLMLQAGMFVAAESFAADLRTGVFTHFKREEDATLQSGKLDEELRRMSRTVDHLAPGSLLLLNESFASTNEREGAEIARQIVGPLLDAGIRVAYVTHMFDLAAGFARAEAGRALFLRAERHADGARTYRLIEAEPLPTSFGGDVYRRVFGSTPTPGPR